jgi:hypothetical protein
VTQEQTYQVVAEHGDVELRRYAPCVLAEVVVSGSAERAGNTAFRPLLSYISGRNRSRVTLDMTSPVLQSNEKLAMTAPVIQQATTEERWMVSFVLPGSREIEDYPEPLDASVTLRAVPTQDAAVLRWSGRWTSSNVSRRTEQLRAVIGDAGWTEAGEPRWARFDPPWKPAFARRNEIVIPVSIAS